ncbi:MAG: gliding motility-associated ABC transporter ATP-binding subunit GldA [Bacteroidales bacterium]
MSLEALNVTKYYGQQKALDDVSFSISQGEVVALLGPNGAGKSTMMKIIACYLPQTSGVVKVCGHDVLHSPLKVKAVTGYLPENNPLYYDMYVKEYLHFIAGMHKLGNKSRQRVEEVVEMTGLGPEYRKTIGKLSKGFRQRVGLAQALIHDPKVLILDEPTSGLDPNQLVEIRQLIKTIGQEKTVILSTHIMQEVEAVCSRVMIINKGRIITDKPTDEVRLLNKAKHVIRVAFDQTINTEKLAAMNDVMEVVHEDGTEYSVFTGTSRDIRPDIFHFAVEEGVVLLSMQQHEQSLEKVFREITEERVRDDL